MARNDEDTSEERELTRTIVPLERTESTSSLFTEKVVTIAALTGRARILLTHIVQRLDHNVAPEKKQISSLKTILKHIDETYTITLREMLHLKNQNTTLHERAQCLEEQLHDTNESLQQLINKIPSTKEIAEAIQETLTITPPAPDCLATTSSTSSAPHIDNNTELTYSKILTQKTHKKKLPNPTRNTLIIKGVQETTSKDIETNTTANSLLCPNKIIHRKKPHRNNMNDTRRLQHPQNRHPTTSRSKKNIRSNTKNSPTTEDDPYRRTFHNYKRQNNRSRHSKSILIKE